MEVTAGDDRVFELRWVAEDGRRHSARVNGDETARALYGTLKANGARDVHALEIVDLIDSSELRKQVSA